jgi:hypothetical protein
MIKFISGLLLSLLLFSSANTFGNTAVVQDPCTDNDDCEHAIDIPNVVSGQGYVCVQGCNLFASPEAMDNSCQIGIYPTVWYKLSLDSIADVLNILVSSTEFDQPVISLFKSSNGCNQLDPINYVNGNMSCAIGSNGQVEALGNQVSYNYTYYIAVSSFNSIGGNFDICVSTNSQSSICVIDRNITVVARSNAGPLEGPFDPKEKVSICMNVNQYTSAGNGCQWFQGIVPVFGNGWDPSSFDSIGQPLNATLNGNATGLEGNGLYGTATWDWFDSVGYHHDNPDLTIADLDGNGRLDMCNSKYEMDCPNVGVLGGSGGPCWDENQGDLLPPGWFAYGINGTCPTPGPPIRVDWGDGNTCGGGMGPWQFCFDLITRDVPDCMGDSTKRNLALGFFTFADGEIGAWTGSSSVCAMDHPVKLSLQAKCGKIAMGNIEPLPPLCSGDTLRYKIEETGVVNWEWNISPFWAVPYLTNHGENGFTIEAPLVNTSDEPVDITGVLIGTYGDSPDIIIRRFQFTLHTIETCPFVSVNDPEGSTTNKIRIYPTPTDESAILEWSFDLKRDATIQVYNSQGILMNSIPVSSHEGYQKQIDTQSLVPGVYFVSFSNGEFRYVTRLVKM